MSVRWAAVNRPKLGQTVSGDGYLVTNGRNGQVLVACVDGLGGGHEAAKAANLALEVLQARPDLPLQDLMNRCHAALQGTRGCVAGLMTLDVPAQRMVYCGVGNIGVHVYGSTAIKPISKNGIIGYRMPTLLELKYTFDLATTFVLYSDGISSRFGIEERLDLNATPQALAERIIERYGKATDDATVVVVQPSL